MQCARFYMQCAQCCMLYTLQPSCVHSDLSLVPSSTSRQGLPFPRVASRLQQHANAMELLHRRVSFYGASTHDPRYALVSLSFPWRCFMASHTPPAFFFFFFFPRCHCRSGLFGQKILDWERLTGSCLAPSADGKLSTCWDKSRFYLMACELGWSWGKDSCRPPGEVGKELRPRPR